MNRLTHALAIAAATSTLIITVAGSSSADPGDTGVATMIGNRTFFEDGTVEVDVPVGTDSLGQCASGEFCVWSQANYTGSFRYKTGTGSKPLGGTVGSFWNNRSSVARLYTNTASTSTCYGNGVKKASVSSSYSSAEKVTLSSSANC